MRPTWGALLLLLSCQAPGVPCDGTADCQSSQACIAERCQDVDCLSSDDCELESFCDVATNSCEPGCTSSDDCFAGDRCDFETNTCIARSCFDTQLDCRLGERCNLETHRCEPDPLPHCAPCASDLPCGPTGICGRLQAGGRGFCFLECSPEAFDPCPAGLQCSSAQATDPGEPPIFRCIGQCERN